MSGFLSALLTTGTQAAGAYQQGQNEAQDKNAQSLMGQLQLLRQQREEANKEQLNNADIGFKKAQTAKLNAPALPKLTYDPARGQMVNETAGTASAVQGLSDKPETLTPRTFTADGKPMEGFSDTKGNFYDSAHQKVSGTITPYNKPDAPDKTLTLVQNPNDATAPGVFVPRAQAIGQQAPGKPKAENATNVAAAARLQAAVSEMNNSHNNMGEYEEKLKNGTAKISAPAQLLGRVANAFTHDDPISQLTQSGALSALNQSDPELARYIRRGLSFAEGESMISQRPSDFRTKMAAFLSTAASGASPEMIADIQGRRQSILTPLNETVGAPKKPVAGGGRGGGAPQNRRATDNAAPTLSADDAAKAASDPAFAAWLKDRGHTVP